MTRVKRNSKSRSYENCLTSNILSVHLVRLLLFLILLPRYIYYNHYHVSHNNHNLLLVVQRHNPRRQNGDTEHFLYWQPKNIRRRCTNFRFPGDLAPRKLRLLATLTTTTTMSFRLLPRQVIKSSLHIYRMIKKSPCTWRLQCKNTQKYFKQFNHLPSLTVQYWTRSSRTQLGVSINVWRLAGDTLNITCNFLYYNHQVHRDFLITLHNAINSWGRGDKNVRYAKLH
jgi:hypothetical protein